MIPMRSIRCSLNKLKNSSEGHILELISAVAIHALASFHPLLPLILRSLRNFPRDRTTNCNSRISSLYYENATCPLLLVLDFPSRHASQKMDDLSFLVLISRN